MRKVVVVGGGVSGLACGLGLLGRQSDLDVRVLEARARAGGVIFGEQRDGFTFDAGPSGWLNRNDSTVAWHTLLGLGSEAVLGNEANRRRYILREGRLHRFPIDLASFLRTDLVSVRGKARALLEPLVGRGDDPDRQSAAAFAERRLGREVAQVLVDPVVSGIFAGDPGDLSLEATLPSLARMEAKQGSLLLGAMRRKTRSPTPPGQLAPNAYVSYRGGMSQLVGRMAGELGDRLQLNARVLRIGRDRDRWSVEVQGQDALEADTVVVATPAPVAAPMLQGACPELGLMLDRIPYVAVAVSGLGFRREDVEHPLDGFGYLVPSQERGEVLGVLWSSSIFPGERAPEGHVMIRVIIGGARAPGILAHRDAALVEEALHEVTPVLGVSGPLVFSAVARLPMALPQYRVGHVALVERIRSELRGLPGLHLVGNSLDGVGINSLTAAAARVVEEISGELDVL